MRQEGAFELRRIGKLPLHFQQAIVLGDERLAELTRSPHCPRAAQ
jgi:hypothetical protein